MVIPRIYISAAHKSSGKTTLSLGLCAALTRLGKRVQPLKKGPDYIDPLWLAAASQNACYNLDFNTMSHDEILQLLDRNSSDRDIVLIEGNKGLYDGLELDGSTSNAAMAKLTGAPVILVLDVEGMTRGIAPLLLGYQAFDAGVNIAGVIFNKVGGSRHENKLVQIAEHYTDLTVLGAVHRSSDMLLAERHLGLMPYNEADKALTRISLIADRVQQQVDLHKLLEIAKQGSPIAEYHSENQINKNKKTKITAAQPVKIGICRDAAFGFYYADDLDSLRSHGATLISIDTLQDQTLPEIDALFIGGGFPETQMQQLSENTGLRNAIHNAIENGMPVYAECGGLMYLSESINWQGETWPMVGVIPAKAVMNQRPQGRGYVRLYERAEMPWPADSRNQPSASISAHEFHYSKLQDAEGKLTQKGTFVYGVERGTGIDGQHDGWLYKNLLASYSHMRDTSKYHWTKRFIDFIHKIKQQQE